MSNKKKMKMCASCEGMIDVEVIACPYCGNDLSSKMEEDEKSFNNPIFSPPYNPEEKVLEKVASEKKTSEKIDSSFEDEKEKSLIFPFLIFSLGINILLFGLFLLVFSTNGEVFLKWNAKFWILYTLVGTFFIFIGSRLLSKFK